MTKLRGRKIENAELKSAELRIEQYKEKISELDAAYLHIKDKSIFSDENERKSHLREIDKGIRYYRGTLARTIANTEKLRQELTVLLDPPAKRGAVRHNSKSHVAKSAQWPKPPLVAEALTRLVTKPHLVDLVLDSRAELFKDQVEKNGSLRAKTFYWIDTLKSCWPAIKRVLKPIFAAELVQLLVGLLRRWFGV